VEILEEIIISHSYNELGTNEGDNVGVGVGSAVEGEAVEKVGGDVGDLQI